MATIRLRSTKDVIDKLGGVGNVAALTGLRYNRVWNWTAQKFFPAHAYDVMIRELNAKGYSASPSLWRQTQPQRERVSA